MARKLFSLAEFLATGRTKEALRWGVSKGRIHRVGHGWYVEGETPPTAVELQLGLMLAADGMASSLVAALQMGLDGIVLPSDHLPRRRRTPVSPEPVKINGIWCTDGLQTLVDIAPLVDDLVWEQALECALHNEYLKLDELLDVVPLLTKSRTAGAPRIKRVLALRPEGAPPTESLLETLMVQLARRVDDVPEPERQVVVEDDGRFVARVDLAWSTDDAFAELDGEGHKNQPVYDSVRQTNVTIATGWLCGRFSWREVRWNPVPTGRRLREFIATARTRAPKVG